MWSGYVGGRRDTVLARLVDVLIALPPMLLAIVFVSAFGSTTWILVTVTAIFFVPRIIRIVRGATATVAAEDFVAAARLRGEPAWTILWREIMPSLSGLLLVEFAGRLSNVVIFVATLNFLGLGAQPPSSSWGLMVNETKNLLRTNAFAPLVPALLIAALAVGVSLLADQLAKVLDGGAR
jgi:peptide/nickel transport system permease protein